MVAFCVLKSTSNDKMAPALQRETISVTHHHCYGLCAFLRMNRSKNNIGTVMARMYYSGIFCSSLFLNKIGTEQRMFECDVSLVATK